ncbi:hypothetical protein ONZ51_g2973 [Trametes cubensis]|uniref:Serine/threonine-protein kinase Tel1 n=1 Tax=Trametes cubensis TaxID=1111947 RepID=A0AAD7TYQ5_9APHY|nr:hypothetical protein ONZ51_g2973 [Trametes cubensis]
MSEITLKTVLEGLQGDKETLRAQAVKDLREWFERVNIKDSFSRKPILLLAIFQALFTAYKAQLHKCINKFGSLKAIEASASIVTVRRLTDIVSTVRWLVERAREHLTIQVLKSLLQHFVDAIIYHGELINLVAGDYAQAVGSLLSWDPNLQSMPDDLWHSILAISFNVFLGLSPSRRLQDSVTTDDSEPLDELSDDESPLPAGLENTSGPSISASRPLKRARLAGQTRSTTRQTPNSDQMKFMSLIPILIRSPTAPILSDEGCFDTSSRKFQRKRAFPDRLLTYFSSVLHIYSLDSSFRQNYIVALSAALSHLALNCRIPVENFAQESWQSLVAQWKEKEMDKSEDIIIILRKLFPMLTAKPIKLGHPALSAPSSPVPSFISSPVAGPASMDHLSTLWQISEASANKRTSSEFQLESLLLDYVNHQDQTPFVARTFRHGWKLDRAQALVWSTLELQADCAEKLYLHMESTYSLVASGRKRVKLENPIAVVLQSIKSQANRVMKVHHLQLLLFFADRHWLVLHEQLRRDIITALTSLVSFEDADVQSWTFLCLAAIAHAEGSVSVTSGNQHPSDTAMPSLWDPIWTHAMRRANVPAVSRAAAHAAHILLLHSKRLLSSQRVLLEIEAFVKDLDVQGPAYPYDSVCSFMVLCLRFANQDARLYRMQMEEKVLSWLMQAWRIEGTRRTSMPTSTVAHIHSLLEAITGTSKRTKLWCGIMLPASMIVDYSLEEAQTKVIRDFQLNARLPPYASTSPVADLEFPPTPLAAGDDADKPPLIDSADLAPPRGRERRLSAFLLKSLEALTDHLDKGDEGNHKATAETLRFALDVAANALFFEASLLMNGTQSNRRVIQAACKIISLVGPQFKSSRWHTQERRLLLGALDPFVFDGEEDRFEHPGWEALVPPGENTGIRTPVLQRLLSRSRKTGRTDSQLCRNLQQCLFRSADVQDTFAGLLKTLRELLRMTVKADGAKRDGFGVRSPEDTGEKTTSTDHKRHVARACVTALVMVPILQSSTGHARDKELLELLANCKPKEFLTLAPSCLERIRRDQLYLSSTSLEQLLTQLDPLCQEYDFRYSEDAQLLLVQTLAATSRLWRDSYADSLAGERARFLCWQCTSRLLSTHHRSWRVRDAIIRFFDEYLVDDPAQESWTKPSQDYEPPSRDKLPAVVLPTLGKDNDIRIRFRVAATSPHLFTASRRTGGASMDVYAVIHQHLSTDQTDFDSMITRLVCLGNVVISNASVRRGAYWHLLELALHEPGYHEHLKAVLVGITERLGMEQFSDLFSCYASQFAYSIRAQNIEVSKLPFELLGYQSPRECAEATFRAFTPTNLVAGGERDAIAAGLNLFQSHCQSIRKSEQDAIRECFADLVAQQITYWLLLCVNHPDQEAVERELEGTLKEKTKLTRHEVIFNDLLSRHVDDIVVAILRTLSDQDISANGPIVTALRDDGAFDAAETFLAITQYRAFDTFEPHEPNLPRFNTHIVLHAINWYGRRVDRVDSPAVTYHTLNHLFADIERSPLVNEQLRSLNALCLWISCHGDHFKDPSLLRLLIRRCVSIYAQADLARSTQSLLDWSLSAYKVYTEKADYRLTDVLIRLSTLAYDFSQSLEASLAKLGSDLMAWVEVKAGDLYKNKTMRKHVRRALAAWPRDLPPALHTACDNLRLADLTSALGDDGEGKNNFGKSDFWRLKACIPPQDYLVDSDISAFTSLLMLNHGRIDSVGSDQFTPDTVCTRHRKVMESKTGPEITPRADVDLARTAVIVSLLAMLDTASAPKVYTAYTTLCALMSTLSHDNSIDPAVSSDIRHELEYVGAFPKPQQVAPAPDVSSFLTNEEMSRIGSDYSAWITRVTILLCESLAVQSAFFSPLTHILRSDCAFAEEMLPLLVHSLLQLEYDNSKTSEPGSLRSQLSQYFTSVLAYEDTASATHRAIISVILHLRNFRPSVKFTDALAHDKWLSIDFTLLSRCAIKCGAYTTALLFLELANEYNPTTSQGSTTEDVLFAIYNHIDEPDGFYGIQTDDLRNLFVKRLRHEKQWDKAFRYHGAVLESGSSNPTDTEGIVQSLHSFGFNHLALNTLRSSADSRNLLDTSAIAYSLGWRAQTWDLPETATQDNASATLYLAMRAVHRERNPHVVDNVVRGAFVREMTRLRDLGNEDFTEIRQVAQNLMCLSQIQQWRGNEIHRQLQSGNTTSPELRKYASIEPDFDFSDIEAILTTRVSLVRSIRQKEQRDQIGDLRSLFCESLLDLERRSLLCLSERARDASEAQISLNSVVQAQNLEQNPSSAVSREFASVLWLMKEPKLAIKSLDALVTTPGNVMALDDDSSMFTRATSLAQLGSWSAEASMKKPSQIVADCFSPAVDLILKSQLEASTERVHSAASVFHQFAIFAERQYHTISRSPDALRWKLYIDRKKDEIKQRANQLQRLAGNHPERGALQRQQERAQALLAQDQERAKEHLGQRNTFLSHAVEMLCSLWLANFENDDEALRFEVALKRVPSRKLVFLAHQLTARLSAEQTPTSRNQPILQAVILRMCHEHPFHSVFPLYCIRIDRHSPSSQASGSRRQSGRHASQASPSQIERTTAAATIFSKLLSDDHVSQRIKDVELVCDASLELAKYPIRNQLVNGRVPRSFTVPDGLLVRKLVDIKVPVITAHTPIDPTTQYQDCDWIGKFESHYTTAGGVNLPKIIKCVSTSGRIYKQLYKGEGDDDLRQDAVMEQVFDLVNVVLRRDRETKKRNLSVKGYKVIPLAAQAGVLEFVENTIPLMQWLRPAHPRYRPQDMTTEQAAAKLKLEKRQEWREYPEKVIERFLSIQKRFKPVMRHYFTEKHKTPMSWYSMRLNYARSVATNSIVGHILGVGDRHTSNILIDNKTGEVVHIDLGIAFEQGKLLPQPERVPFRLTADMIDGLGISGTQGVFQRCAEETLRVLRDGSEIILTVLEVFKYDPLHSWTASEFKIKRVQSSVPDETAQLTGEAFRFAIGIDMASGAADEAADRALSTVARKLDKTLSVEYTVNELITEASDPANLALMYVGWTPYW